MLTIVGGIVVMAIAGLLNLYGEVSSLRNTNRVNIKQWELLANLRNRIDKIELEQAYYKGYEKGKTERKPIKVIEK